MQKHFLFFILAAFCITTTRLQAQEYFTISRYDVAVNINQDASLDIDENIFVHFTEPRHGIYRLIPYKYQLQSLPAGTEKAERQLESGGYAHTIVENISVDGWEYNVSTDGDYKSIRIGSADKLVDGDQQYHIHYRMLNAINFFKDHSEFYYNIIGDKWNTTIDSVNFTITLYNALPSTPDFFVATGAMGSRENSSATSWSNNKILTGHTTQQLQPSEGVTVGVVLPKDFLIEQNYNLLGLPWLLLPIAVFAGMFFTWRKWGKDEKPTVQTEYYPPENVSPSISGYIIDDTLNRRDLTALVPYWGANGYLQVKESDKKSFFGLVDNKDYTFIQLKPLPEAAPAFEKTLFNGIFESGSEVQLSSLKNVLYKFMDRAKSQLQTEINRNDYYVKTSGCLFYLFIFLGIIFIAGGIVIFANFAGTNIWLPVSVLASGLIVLLFGIFMRKKTEKGTLLYRKLLGFREFIKSVEQDRLKQFLKEDEHYFDKILPYAIVFGIADTWKDKLAGLDIPPPTWYVGSYTNFKTAIFLSSLNNSMNQMSDTFYSAPSSSGSSGGSFGGGGFSGGGFGGGGGGSW